MIKTTIQIAAVTPTLKIKAEFPASANFGDVKRHAISALAEAGHHAADIASLRAISKGKTRGDGETLGSCCSGGKAVVKLMRSQAGSAQAAADAGALSAINKLEAEAERIAAEVVGGLQAKIEASERAGTLGRQRSALAGDARVAQELVTQTLLRCDAIEMPPRNEEGGGGGAARAARKALVARLNAIAEKVSALGLDGVALRRPNL